MQWKKLCAMWEETIIIYVCICILLTESSFPHFSKTVAVTNKVVIIKKVVQKKISTEFYFHRANSTDCKVIWLKHSSEKPQRNAYCSV